MSYSNLNSKNWKKVKQNSAGTSLICSLILIAPFRNTRTAFRRAWLQKLNCFLALHQRYSCMRERPSWTALQLRPAELWNEARRTEKELRPTGHCLLIYG